MGRLPALLLALLVAALLLFGVFGLLASFEPVPNATAWRIGYGAGVLALVLFELRLLARALRRGRPR